MFTEASTPSKSAPQPGTSKADLIAETKAMVISTDNTLRQIADNLASLRDGHHMSQREIAAAVGKSVAWVNRLLSWRKEGFSEDTPFGGTERRERESVQRAEHRASKPTLVKLGNGEALNSLDGFSEAAKQQIAAAGNDNDPVASAEQRKAEHAASEASTSKPTGSGSGDTTQIKKGSQEWWLSEFQIAVEHYFPKMDDGTRTKAKALAMQWQPGSHLKAVA